MCWCARPGTLSYSSTACLALTFGLSVISYVMFILSSCPASCYLPIHIIYIFTVIVMLSKLFKFVILRHCQYRYYIASMIRWLMNVKQSVEWKVAGETEVLGENPPQCNFVHHKSHMNVSYIYIYLFIYVILYFLWFSCDCLQLTFFYFV
jgi:hypothetical protein